MNHSIPRPKLSLGPVLPPFTTSGQGGDGERRISLHP
jgi:hypothetical protein